eukprot:SAG31_NODE_7599_length_1644_cov_1.270550_1_plen_113_part_10
MYGNPAPESADCKPRGPVLARGRSLSRPAATYNTQQYMHTIYKFSVCTHYGCMLNLDTAVHALYPTIPVRVHVRVYALGLIVVNLVEYELQSSAIARLCLQLSYCCCLCPAVP